MTPEGIKFTKEEWIPALRSGKYKQGFGKLHINDTFCCLGVACDLLKDRLKLDAKKDLNIVRYNEQAEYLPETAADYLGLDQDTQVDIADKNDEGGWNFDQIATYLQEDIVAKS